jgi:unsaturated rhamnogalacturonyl hydrolase
MSTRIQSHVRSLVSSTRRDWLVATGGAGLAALLAGASRGSQPAPDGIVHAGLPLAEAPDLTPEEGLLTGFLGFGWKSFAVGQPGAPVTVLGGLGESAPEVPEGAECRLRLTNSIDVRDRFAIQVATAGGRSVGTFDLQFAGLYQVQEIPLSPEDAREILARGAVLKMVSGPKPVWFFAPSPDASPAPDPVQLPHVLVASEGCPAEQFERRLRGLVMLQGFGWQSGCVSEGLLDLARTRQDAGLLEAVDRYLGMYFTDEGVFFESPRSLPMRNRVGGIEEPLPWATLGRRQPDHPAIRLGADFLRTRTDPGPSLAKGQSLTTEGNYTAAYPTAVLARTLDRDDLAELALRHLEARKTANVHDGDIYQRGTPAGPVRLRNWCRGVCWYYLGIVRTLDALDDSQATAAWQPEIRRVAELLWKHQRSDGLWGNFLHDPQSVTDTSGSAGLAAALAIAHRSGWLPVEARQAAERTRVGLAGHLTPDGLLGGAAQSNKGGDSLQTSSYRVIYQMGMGLKAQLMAALEGNPAGGDDA